MSTILPGKSTLRRSSSRSMPNFPRCPRTRPLDARFSFPILAIASGIAIVFALRLDVGLGRILGRGRFLTHGRRGRLDRQIAADGLHRQVTAPVADDDRPILAALTNDASRFVAFEVAARGVVIADAGRAQEADLDVAADRLEPAFESTSLRL